MVVSELIEILKRADQSATVELEVYRHVYNSEDHLRSHGPLRVMELRHEPRVVAIVSGCGIERETWRLLGNDKRERV